MGVIVLGMHRSGTSAMTGALHRLGLPVGDPEALIPESRHNPRGHWEVKDLVFVNEMLLDQLGGSWDDPADAGPVELRALADSDWGEGARRAHAQSLGDGLWVWKDPRLCLLMELWREVLSEPPVVVMMVRSPGAVARSLEKRSNFELDRGLCLWDRYTRAAIEGSRGLPTRVFHYEDLLASPRRTLAGALDFLDSVGVAPMEPDLDAAVEQVTRPGSANAPNAEAEPPPARDLYRWLCDIDGLLDERALSELPAPAAPDGRSA